MSVQMDPTLGRMYEFRSELVEDLALDVIGPGEGESEIISEAPLDRYIVGVLWPSTNERQEAPDPDGAQPADDEPTEDSPIPQSLMRYPSSMGLTFSVRLDVSTKVSIGVTGARYAGVADGAGSDRKAARNQDWQRYPLDLDPIGWSVAEAGTFEAKTYEQLKLAEGLELYIYVRPPRDDVATISVALKNTNRVTTGELRDDKSWFQVGLSISTDRPAIVDRTSHQHVSEDRDPDLASAALLYRNAYTFAIGHGCAVTWDHSSARGGAIDHIETTFLPTYEVPRARPGLLDESIDLRMSFLADASDNEIVGSLTKLVDAYRQWINDLEGRLQDGAADVPRELLPTAYRHVRQAREAASRIERGVSLLEQDQVVMEAFRAANTAMQRQRARQVWIRSGASGEVGDGGDQRWYPFQIAYILLNLQGLVNPDHPDRQIADLLWFPTGGGKTEAYLGLIAFSILYRRLGDPDATGVAVIMRYTLRLLTIQQFERATMLMCSLETVRRSTSRFGQRSFSIGLWVGSGGTPNSLDEARKALRDLRSGRELAEKNPVQLRQCPWCGNDLDYNNYEVRNRPERHLHIACGNSACDFGEGLPVHVVDDDIYRVRPELILGTVDKFAAMAWNENVGKLFARDGIGYPPHLIIQDELHLISGPLGSMVGLYESAVDAACEVDSLLDEQHHGRPKVIASTATIRRAEQQVRAVFDRASEQFPPPGIDPDESFFAEPAPRESHGTRQYVGIMAPGASHATLMVRVYAALLQGAKDIDAEHETRDPYWTLLGYFNSLRVLGSASLQVDGDVRERLKVVASRKKTEARKLRPSNELTSRVPSPEIPERLKSIEKRLGEGKPDDVVLATNMISVGVDIDRLGLMAVMGQPQSSSEYIQATSRVGRKYPGLVVTIFNSARSRDRSHYESFVPFHQAMYRAVEATSATPFAARARDRGLHGVLVSMARLLVPDLAPDGAAYLASDNWDALQEVARLLAQRAKSVVFEGKNPDELTKDERDALDAEVEAIKDQIGRLLDVWSDEGDAKPNMRYRNAKNLEAALLVDPATALMSDSIEYSQAAAPWPTMQSMRDVDAESGLYQIAMRRSK